MSGDIAAAGDVITGALAARSVESHDGEGQGEAGSLCLNCGTRLIGAHCHACGQSGHVHRSLGAIGHELAHGVFHFEGKIWRTLPMLVMRPGTLTRRYVAGERARFVSPLALFLFTVFLMFATISAVGGDFADTIDEPGNNQTRSDFVAQASKARTGLAAVQRKRADLAKAGQPTDEEDTQILVLKASIDGLDAAAGVAPERDDGLNLDKLKTGWPKLDRGIAKAKANPGLMIYKLQSSAYKYSWLLIPLSTPFVALLFLWRRRFGWYDHAIFVTYSLAFMMLLVIVLTIAGALGIAEGWIVVSALLVPPVHMFAQLRGAYSLRKRSALWRTVALVNFAGVVMAAFLVLLLLRGLTE
ncbi:MAG TPA: DUF3667 domain-containing protein [Sphingomonas sp.]|nr:DUF3667 domain-containing protein [Sphingomonas sp.]